MHLPTIDQKLSIQKVEHQPTFIFKTSNYTIDESCSFLQCLCNRSSRFFVYYVKLIGEVERIIKCTSPERSRFNQSQTNRKFRLNKRRADPLRIMCLIIRYYSDYEPSSLKQFLSIQSTFISWSKTPTNKLKELNVMSTKVEWVGTMHYFD